MFNSFIIDNLGHFHVRLTCILAIVFMWVLKTVILKRKTILDVLALLACMVISYFIKITNNYTEWLITICYVCALGYAVYSYFVINKTYIIKKSKIHDYLKNSEFEYYLQVNEKNKIIDYSANILTLTNRNKDGIKNQKFPDYLFDCLNVHSVNDELYTLNTLPSFRAQLEETNSKLKQYTFNFAIKDETNQIIKFNALIQPIFFGKKLIAKNIFISLDKIDILTKTRRSLTECITDLEDAKNQLYVLMSITSGVVMYFDFQNKVYYATEALQKFTNTNKTEYDFDDFLKMLHPEDVEFYINQTATINSLNTTRLKYRLLIGDRYYSVIEDSINLIKDDKLISVIRVCSNEKHTPTPEIILSTKESEDLLDDLESANINNTADDTLDILNKLRLK